MGESTRVSKLNRLILKDLASIFQQRGQEMFGDAMISVTEVKTSPDLSIAKCYLSFFNTQEKNQKIKEINLRKSEVRGLLGNKIGKHVRKVPDLIFFLDDTAAYASKMDNLISGLEIPKSEKDYGLEAYDQLEE